MFNQRVLFVAIDKGYEELNQFLIYYNTNRKHDELKKELIPSPTNLAPYLLMQMLCSVVDIS